MSISSFLKKKFVKSLFLPSHNRGRALPINVESLLREKPGFWDLPELPEMGSILSEDGLISSAQKYFAEQFSVNNCWFGVNGATGLIQSAIVAMAKPGDYILMPRNIHLSVIRICILANIKPIFFDLPVDAKTGHYKTISKSWFLKVLREKLLENIKISGTIFVNPHYQGYSTDLEPVIEICHQHDIPVLVDEAHGSYFLFCEDLGLPKSSVRSGADLVVHSLHKSLNGLTQTAILWHNGNLIKTDNIIDSISLLQTTSPSALLLSSCEESIKDWLDENNVKNYSKRISEARNLYQKLIQSGVPLIMTQDPLKLVLNTGSVGIDGFTADDFFYKNGLIAELPEMMTLTFCLGFAEHCDFLEIFRKIWLKLLTQIKTKKRLIPFHSPYEFVQMPKIPPAEAWSMGKTKLPLDQSIGKISAEIICPYPPGIPLMIPGEEIDKNRVDWIQKQSLFCKDLINSYISVLNI